MNLWWIDLPYTCAGIFTNDEKIVVQAAPIFGWMRGRRIEDISRWVKNRRGEMKMIKGDPFETIY
jgi:hypothetical protein